MSFGALVFNRNGRVLFDSRVPSLVAVERHVIPYFERPYPNSGTHAVHLDGSGDTYLSSLFNYYISTPRPGQFNSAPSLPDDVLYFVKIPSGGFVTSTLRRRYNTDCHMLLAQGQEQIELVTCRPIQPNDLPKNSHGAIFYDRDGNVTWHSEAPVVSLVDVVTGDGEITVSADAPWVMLPRMYWVDQSHNSSSIHYFQKDFPIGVRRVSDTKLRLGALLQSTSYHNNHARWTPTPALSLTARINTDLIPTNNWPNLAPF